MANESVIPKSAGTVAARQLLGMLLLIAMANTPAMAKHKSAATERVQEPNWVLASALKNQRDRKVVDQFFSENCPSNWLCPGDDEREAQRIEIGRGRTILVARMPSHGTCGVYDFAVYGPIGREGHRLRGPKAFVGRNLIGVCGEDLAVRRRGSHMPDLVTLSITDRFASAGPVAETTTWRWSGRAYRAARRRRERFKIDD